MTLAKTLIQIGISNIQLDKMNNEKVLLIADFQDEYEYKKTVREEITINIDEIISLGRFNRELKGVSWLGLGELTHKNLARKNPPHGHPQYFKKEKFDYYLNKLINHSNTDSQKFVDAFIKENVYTLDWSQVYANYYENLGYIISGEGNHRTLLMKLIGAKQVKIKELNYYARINS
ncbi:hypothetical protein FH508_0012230 [Lysinibacillus sp. CD3-6]|uniref:hypothetical protein n=1 Tax=Lysinibacillus sp. CD3-6 TaxID=2892541 RepID=UPI00116F1905|nr:hypothetical protein [Lysinibacillus sp. CD3-6]UED78237.1 hypothetical protein FH508_0012230 [Lysinibacillus sp. CD3-6]